MELGGLYAGALLNHLFSEYGFGSYLIERGKFMQCAP